ncbi:MAG: tyrosine recombinase [Elusimicrobiota bacterium]
MIQLDDFIRHLELRGLSRNTCLTYRRQLQGYLGFLAARGRNVSAVGRGDVLDYLESRKKAGLKSASLFLAIVAVRQFYRYFLGLRYAMADPTAGMLLPKFTQRLPEPLSVAEMERLLAVPTGVKFTAIRNRAMLELLYATGIRISELVSLHFRQVDLAEGWVRVLGKGNRERVVPIGRKAREALTRYLAAREKRSIPASAVLFVSVRGRPMTRGEFWCQLKALSARAGITGNFPHRIRHSAATHLLAGGADLRALQELLGHKRITTTERYTHVEPAHLRRVWDRAHPRQ